MTELFLDFETFSKADLKKVGLSRYARHASTEALMLAWAFDDDEVELVSFAEGERAPKVLKEALRDPDVIKRAWNAQFEQAIFSDVLGLHIPPEEWRCSMVMAFSLSFPGALEKVGQIIGLPEDAQKMKEGKALIKRFCGLRKPTKKEPFDRCTHHTHPDEWETFKQYCMRDVDAERAIERKLRKWDLPKHEWDVWHLDQRINQAGIPINMRVVENAIKVANNVTSARLARMRELTDLANPNSTKQLLPWLKSAGYTYNDIKKAHVAKAVAEQEDPTIKEVLGLRQEVSKSSVKKYNALKAATDDDGMLRNAFQFGGAQRTLRWAGRRFQAQNLAKPVKYLESPAAQAAAVRHLEVCDTETIEMIYPKPMDLLSTCVRPVVQATEGHLFTDADLNAIENRVVGWLADDQKILDVFRNGRCPYLDFATYMFHEPYEDLWYEYDTLKKKDKRTVAKPGVLGCAYLLGAGKQEEDPETGEITATGLLGYAWNMGVKLTPAEAKLSVDTFRSVYEGVVQFWDDLDKAARRCIRTKEPQRVRYLTFDMSGPFMRMGLPSGRYIHYYQPRIEMRRKPWGDIGPTITYMGLNDKGHWGRITTHPGKLVENAVQAVARDILAHGMMLADKRGLDIRLHIHDQIITMEPAEKAHERLEILRECMSTVPKWAPGLILATEGEVSHAFFKT